ncbi:MAG: hypothetical protein ACOC2D_00070 [Spirochaetota bacterium]
MIRRFGLLYTVFSVLVLVVLVVLVLGRLTTARNANLSEAEASFGRLQSQLAEQGETDAPVTELLREYASIVPTVRAVVLFDPERGLRYVWTAEADLLAVPASDFAGFRGYPEYRLNDVGQVRLREQIALDGGSRFYLDAVYRVLSFTDAYPALRDSLVSLLVFAFLTVLVALALGRADGAPSPTRAASAPAHPSGAPTQAPQPETPAGDAPAESAPQPEYAPPGSGAVVAPETHDRLSESDWDHSYEEISVEEIATEPGDPGTLFNPVTGLSHRDHLERRLGLELERSAYNDQDLTCLIVRFPGMVGEEAYVERAKQVLGTFQFEDLCFEYDPTSYCVVLPNTELPQGLRQAESFRKRHPDSIIGLSARNGRLVEARRVLTEAERSLDHAANEPGGIVGFRPDPRKYRQFVTQHLAGEE